MKYLVLTSCLLLSGAEQASAAFLTRSGVFLQEIGNPYYPPLERIATDNWAEGGTSSSAATSLPLTSGAASVDLITNPGIRLSAVAETGPDGLGGWISYSGAASGAGWHDVIRVSGAAAPSTLRLMFNVEGSFGFDLGVLGSGNTRFAMVMFPDSSNTYLFEDDSRIPAAWAAANALPTSDFQAYATRFPAPDFFLSPPGLTTNFQALPGGAVSWDASFDLWYNPELGGYDMAFYASLLAESFDGGRTDADFGSTIRLTALTNVDGSPLDGTVSFDSGFQLGNTGSPVPEPASAVLFAIGGVGLILGRRRATKASINAAAKIG